MHGSAADQEQVGLLAFFSGVVFLVFGSIITTLASASQETFAEKGALALGLMLAGNGILLIYWGSGKLSNYKHQIN